MQFKVGGQILREGMDDRSPPVGSMGNASLGDLSDEVPQKWLIFAEINLKF
jgi:hypothetical protein